MLNRKLKLHLIKSKKDLYINFKNKQSKIIIVTGITGSGKSYTSKKLSKEYKIPVLCFDIIYSYKQDRQQNELEKKLIEQFFSKYPEYKNANELVYLERNAKDKFLEINNKFYDFVLEYVQNNNLKIILDGACFCNDVSFEKFKNERIVVKRTSFLKTIIQRTKRCINRNKGTNYRVIKFLKDIKYTIFHLKEWYIAIDGFLKKIENSKILDIK